MQISMDRPWRVHSSLLLCGSTPAPPTLHCSLEPDLEQRGPGEGLPQSQPRLVPGGCKISILTSSVLSTSPFRTTAQHQIQDEHSRERIFTLSCFGQNCRCSHRLHLSSLWPYGLNVLQQSPPLRQGMHSRATKPYQTQPSGFLLQQLQSRTYALAGLWQPLSKEEALPTSSTGLDFTTATTLLSRG